MMLRACFFWLALASAAMAQNSPAENAQAAADRLTKAGQLLDQADGANNRVKALTEAILAYEDGLEAVRDSIRIAAKRENDLTTDLETRGAEIAQLLGVLQGISGTPTPVLLLHPSGPVGTARSGMIMSDVTPALTSEFTTLRDQITEIRVLRSLQTAASDKLTAGLQSVQDARVRLNQAIADRTELPRRFTHDPVKTALLLASTETLAGFAGGLSHIAVDEVPGSLPDISNRKGQLSLPVNGRVILHAGEQDIAGNTRPGIVVATRPNTLVTTPLAATIRYHGELLNYGNVVILEPQAGVLLVLAGLGAVFGEIGEVIPGGNPIGIMKGTDTTSGVILNTTDKDPASAQTETLYIEVRQDNTPVDPAEWFMIEKQGLAK